MATAPGKMLVDIPSLPDDVDLNKIIFPNVPNKSDRFRIWVRTFDLKLVLQC